MARNTRLIPIYTTSGDVGGFLRYPYIFNRQGEWIGWVTPDREVYSVHGHYVGWLSDDPRVLRKIASDHHKPQYVPPNPPEKIAAPASVPLAPMMAELVHGVVDVLDDADHLMPSVDFGDLREDMD